MDKRGIQNRYKENIPVKDPPKVFFQSWVRPERHIVGTGLYSNKQHEELGSAKILHKKENFLHLFAFLLSILINVFSVE